MYSVATCHTSVVGIRNIVILKLTTIITPYFGLIVSQRFLYLKKGLDESYKEFHRGGVFQSEYINNEPGTKDRTMSNAQKEALKKVIAGIEVWSIRGLFAVNIWFLSEVYQDLKSDYKALKSDVQSLKENDREQFTAIEFLKDQIKAKR